MQYDPICYRGFWNIKFWSFGKFKNLEVYEILRKGAQMRRRWKGNSVINVQYFYQPFKIPSTNNVKIDIVIVSFTTEVGRVVWVILYENGWGNQVYKLCTMATCQLNPSLSFYSDTQSVRLHHPCSVT